MGSGYLLIYPFIVLEHSKFVVPFLVELGGGLTAFIGVARLWHDHNRIDFPILEFLAYFSIFNGVRNLSTDSIHLVKNLYDMSKQSQCNLLNKYSTLSCYLQFGNVRYRLTRLQYTFLLPPAHHHPSPSFERLIQFIFAHFTPSQFCSKTKEKLVSFLLILVILLILPWICVVNELPLTNSDII